MISKIYLVISCSGQYEEYYEKVEKAFKDVKKAEIKHSGNALMAEI